MEVNVGPPLPSRRMRICFESLDETLRIIYGPVKANEYGERDRVVSFMLPTTN